MKKILRYLFSLITGVALASALPAQSHSAHDIFLIPEQENIATQGDELLGLTVKISNKSSSDLAGVINITAPDGALIITSKTVVPVALAAADSMFIPVKIYVPAKVASGKKYTVKFQLKSTENNSILKEASSQISVAVKRNISLYALTPSLLLESNTDSLTIPVRIINMGNTTEVITVVNALPYGNNGGFHTAHQLQLASYRDTVIYFRKKVNGAMFQKESFDATINGFYASGELFGVSIVKIQTARSKRRFDETSYRESFNDNYLSVSAENILNPYKSYMLSTVGNTKAGSANITYSLDATAWGNGSNPLIRNTWVGLQSKTAGLRVGNLSRNFEINLSGRGASFFLRDTLRKNQFETGVIDKTYNLFGRSASGRLAPGYSGWASFSHKKETLGLVSTLLYDKNPYMGTESGILSNDIDWMKSKNLHLSGFLNGGYVRDASNADNRKFSSAGGININARIGKTTFTSENFLSDGFYPGFRKGAKLFSEQINWAHKSLNIWTNFNYNHYRPKDFMDGGSEYGSSRISMGFSKTLFKNVLFALTPEYYRETSNNSYLSGQTGPVFLKAFNVNMSVGYFGGPGTHLSLNTETGSYISSYNDQRAFHFKATSNYGGKTFSLISTFQTGDFFLGELAASQQKKQGINTTFSVGPAFQKAFFQKRYNLTGSAAYMRSSITGTNLGISTRSEYDVMPNTKLFANITYSQLKSKSQLYQSDNLQIGLIQKLPSPSIMQKTSTLVIFLYKDINQNMIYDKGDSAAVNQTLLVDQTILLSSKKGTASYQNIPKGSYAISVPYSKGWYAMKQNVYIGKNTRLEIPLQKTAVLEGEVFFSFSSTSYEVSRNKAGMLISVSDAEGRSFTSKTNEEGKFILYLPAGKYITALKTDNIATEIECTNNNQLITLSPQTKTTVSFTLKIKERKIEAKKFKSQKSG